MFCPKCGLGNPDTSQFCEGCGNKLSAPNHASVQLGKDGYQAQPSYSNKDYYEAFIGEKNQHYYLEKFLKFDRDGKTSATWHWPAFFVTFYWLLYRKMWVQALLYFLSPYLALIAGAIIAAVLGNLLSDSAGMSLFGLLYVLFYAGMFIVPAMYANAWYYKHAKRKIAATTMYENNPQKRLGILAGRGGTSGIIVFILLFFFFIGTIGILAAIAIPAYQDYVHRAQHQQAIITAKHATNAVTDYYQQHHKAPQSLADTTFNEPNPKFVEDIRFDGEHGVVVVEMQNRSTSGDPGKIFFTPEQGESGDIIWTCSAEEIPARQLPPECR